MNGSIAFVTIEEPGQALDLRYVSYGSTKSSLSKAEIAYNALKYVKESQEWPKGTKFKGGEVHLFDSTEEYLKYLRIQLDNFFNSN